MTVRILQGDCREKLAELADSSIDRQAHPTRDDGSTAPFGE